MLDDRLFGRFGVEYAPNEIIFCEFEPGNEFYFILSGKVKVVKIINSREKTIDVLEEGDVFGEMSILEEAPRSATIIAIEPVRLLKFHRDNFDALLQGNPQLAYKLMVIFSKRIYDQKRRLMILLLDDSQMRVIDVLNMLSEQDPQNDFTDSVTINVTPDQVASWAGLKPEDVQKELTHLSKMNKIELFGDKIKVKNTRDLQRIVASKRKNMSTR